MPDDHQQQQRPPGIAELQHRYFGDGPPLTQGERELLQAWHVQQGHQAANPVSGSCFCCCEECDPRC